MKFLISFLVVNVFSILAMGAEFQNFTEGELSPSEYAEMARDNVGTNSVFLRSVNTSSCTWTNVAKNGIFGYLCSSYPFQSRVPDLQSTQSALTSLERRIQALESQLAHH